MEYYTELHWMLPLVGVSFLIAALLVYFLYRQGRLDRWMKPKE